MHAHDTLVRGYFLWGVIQDRYVANGHLPTVVCSVSHVEENVWAIKEVFGRTPEAD